MIGVFHKLLENRMYLEILKKESNSKQQIQWDTQIILFFKQNVVFTYLFTKQKSRQEMDAKVFKTVCCVGWPCNMALLSVVDTVTLWILENACKLPL